MRNIELLSQLIFNCLILLLIISIVTVFYIKIGKLSYHVKYRKKLIDIFKINKTNMFEYLIITIATLFVLKFKSKEEAIIYFFILMYGKIITGIVWNKITKQKDKRT